MVWCKAMVSNLFKTRIPIFKDKYNCILVVFIKKSYDEKWAFYPYYFKWSHVILFTMDFTYIWKTYKIFKDIFQVTDNAWNVKLLKILKQSTDKRLETMRDIQSFSIKLRSLPLNPLKNCEEQDRTCNFSGSQFLIICNYNLWLFCGFKEITYKTTPYITPGGCKYSINVANELEIS